MYKKIIKSLVSKESVKFISEHFEGIKFYEGHSKNTIITMDKDTDVVKFESEVMAYLGQEISYGLEMEKYDFYKVYGLVHQTGNISIMRVYRKFDGTVMAYNTDTHEIEYVNK